MKRKWWQNKVFYQIWPKSFSDSNGDGIGDLRGVIEKLDYLKNLGVDVVWLSPIYPSPLADQGYDISDYYNIDERFGTLADFDELLKELHRREMYLLMDLVVNHCSDEHEWFKKAVDDPDGPYGKYFYIVDRPKDGSLPTNWRSSFGGPVWEPLPGHPDKLYLHLYHKKQVDLNWKNPLVREEIIRMVNWWLDRGLDGFRLDAIACIAKPDEFKKYPADQTDGLCSFRRPISESKDLGNYLKELRDRTFRPHDAFTVGELHLADDGGVAKLIGDDGYFCSMFDFEATWFGFSPLGWYDNQPCAVDDYRDCCFKTQKQTGTMGFMSNIIENHDQPRGVSRFIPASELSDISKKALAMFYFFLRGLPFIYQGQEIGMENVKVKDISEIDDILARSQFQTALAAGIPKEKALEVCETYSRDNTRTPMQWNDGDNAGFTDGTPWLPVNPNYQTINVQQQEQDQNSVLNFYREMTRLRKQSKYEDTFVYGTLHPYLKEEKHFAAYLRVNDENGQRILIAVNMQCESRRISVPGKKWRELLTNFPGDTLGRYDWKNVEEGDNLLTLGPWQAMAVELWP